MEAVDREPHFWRNTLVAIACCWKQKEIGSLVLRGGVIYVLTRFKVYRTNLLEMKWKRRKDILF